MNYISLTLKPTDACNMRCAHCYHAEDGFSTEKLPIEVVQETLRLASEEYSKINILIHGGEPTLMGVDYIREIIEFEEKIENCNNVAFTNKFQTNGLLLDKEWIDLFKSNKIVLGISFDGLHNDILRSDTQRVFENIKLLKENDVKFAILCVETSKTIDKLIENYEWFKKENLSYKILPVFKAGFANEQEELLIDEYKYVNEMINFYEYWLMDKDCNIRVNTVEEFLRLFISDMKLTFSSSCIKHRLAVCSDGSIYPCGRPYNENFRLGFIGDKRKISEYFDTPEYRRLLDIYENRQRICSRECDYYLICGGGCISNSILDGSYSSINGKSCRQSKMLFERIEAVNKKIIWKKIKVKNPRALKLLNRMNIELRSW